MQAIIALCYFCENHGPRIVMTCQPIRNSTSRKKKHYDLEPTTTTEEGMDTSEFQQFYDDFDYHLEVVDEEERCTFDYYIEKKTIDEQRCAACSSFGNGLGLLSNDQYTSYISTQVPINEKAYHLVRHACLRSLSVEISTPYYSGDDQPSTTSDLRKNLPSNSNIKFDAEKDGVVLFGDDENGYTLCHTFRLKDAKARGFHRSYSLIIITMDKLMLLNHYDFFLNGFVFIISKLQEQAKTFFSIEQGQNLDLAATVNRAAYLPQDFFKQKISFDTSRSLTIITNNNEIFHNLHRQMLYLLRTQITLIRDVVMEGVPTQDMLVLMEIEKYGLEETDFVASLSTDQTRHHLRNLKMIASILHELNPDYLNELICQVIVGNQVIVKSGELASRRQFLLALAYLLPIGCVRLASHATTYHHVFKYNLMGIAPNIVIPNENLPDLMVISLNPPSSKSSETLENLKFTIENSPKWNGLKPKLVQRYTQLLLDPSVKDQVLETAISSTRTEWLNRAKLMFQLSRQKEGIDLNRVLQIVKCNKEDSPVLAYWQQGLSKRYKQVVLNTIKESPISSL